MWSTKQTMNMLSHLKNCPITLSSHHTAVVKRRLHAKLVSCQFSTATEESKEIHVREKIQLKQHTVKKVKREPFVKNFFRGKIDTDLMAFPEILDRQLIKDVEHTVQSINEIYQNKANSKSPSVEKEMKEAALLDFKEMGLFGRLVPSKYNGLDLSHTALVRLNEALGLDWSTCATLGAHEFLAVQALLVAGTEEQKAKYLPDMASGKCIGAMCCSEPVSGIDLNSVQTTAFTSSSGTGFAVNGTKHWVTNAEMADVFIVFVKMAKIATETDNVISALLINRNSEGVVISPEVNKNCLHGSSTCTVTFRNVQVPKENIIGQVGEGPKILLKVLETCNFGMASFTFGTLKELVGLATEHVINNVRFDKPMTASPLLRRRLAAIATYIYAMESASYFTAGLIDSTEDPDCALECAILKVFNSEGTSYCLKELMKIFGCQSLLKSHVLEKYCHDAQALESFEGTNDMARLFISLMGLRYMGQMKAEFVMKIRNPFFFPYDAVTAAWRHHRIMRGKEGSYGQDVAGHLHPSLVVPGNRLEECVQKLEVLAEHVLSIHGKDIVYHQLDPVTLADVAIDLYAMSAVLARSSRSYCIGLQNADPEVRMATVFCHEAYLRISQHFTRLARGTYQNNNGNFMRIAEHLVDWRGYYPEHPLKYNY